VSWALAVGESSFVDDESTLPTRTFAAICFESARTLWTVTAHVDVRIFVKTVCVWFRTHLVFEASLWTPRTPLGAIKIGGGCFRRADVRVFLERSSVSVLEEGSLVK
jgi:hypothetical protein